MNQTQKTLYWRTSRRFQNVKFLRLSNDFHVLFASKSLMEYGFNVTLLNDTAPLFTSFISHSETDYFVTDVFSRFNSGENRIQLEFSVLPDKNANQRTIFCLMYKNSQSNIGELCYDCYLLEKESRSFCSDLADACEMETDLAYKRAFDNLDIPMSVSSDMSFQYVNKAFSEMVDYSLNQLHCMRLNSIVGDNSYSTLISRENKHYNGYATERNITELRSKNDSTISAQVVGAPLCLNNQTTSMNFYIDITEANRIHREHNEIVTIINNISEAILVTDINQSEIWTNNAFTECTGFRGAEITDFTKYLKHTDGSRVDMSKAIIPVMSDSGIWQGVLEVERKDKTTFMAQATLISTGTHKQHRFALIITDLSLDIMREKQLARHESSDKLTGINIREYFLKNLETACQKADTTENALYLLVFEIDNFRAINEEAGFDIGDTMLRTISMRMSAVVGDRTRISRFGGVSFALYFYATEKERFITSFIQYIKLPFVFEKYDGYVNVSVGIATLEKSQSVDDLCKNAFRALEEAEKTKGKNSCILYENGKLRPISSKDYTDNY